MFTSAAFGFSPNAVLEDDSPEINLRAATGGTDMMAMKRALTILLLSACVSSCLLQDVRHTLVVEADGIVTWRAYQSDIRSDGKTPDARDREELEFWELVRTDEHPVAVGLREIGGMDLRTTILRDRRPYSVLTTARFSSLAEIFEGLIAASHVPGKVETLEGRDSTTLVVHIDLCDVEDADPSASIPHLFAEGKAWQIVLAEGRFVKATGFTLADANTAAMLDEVEDETLEQNGGQLTLSLTWSNEG